jgi:hypothetical protein
MDDDMQCASGRVLIVLSYYRAAQQPDLKEVRLEVRFDAICMPIRAGEAASTSARVVMQPFTLAYRTDDHDERLKRIREAAADYTTDKLDELLGGNRLDTELWMSANSFPPASALQVITDVNDRLNEGLTDILRNASVGAGSPAVVADVGTGIAADLDLAPIAEPIRVATKTIELAGLAIGVITCQPHLAVACGKALAHGEIRTLGSRAIADTIGHRASSPEGSIDRQSPVREPDPRLGFWPGDRPTPTRASDPDSPPWQRGDDDPDEPTDPSAWRGRSW